jgi:hypothetical protein
VRRRGVSSESDPMSALREERPLNAHQRRALKLLAGAGEQRARLFNHGVLLVSMLADLVCSGSLRDTARP